MATTRAKARPPSPFVMKLRNALLSLRLRSPCHAEASQTLLLLAFRGKKSGKQYRFPVGYIQEGQFDLVVLTPRMRSWWKNFRQGAPVTVYVQGRKRQGMASVDHDDREAIAPGITTFLRLNPQAAPMYRVELDAAGDPTPDTLQRVIPHWIVVRIHLTA